MAWDSVKPPPGYVEATYSNISEHGGLFMTEIDVKKGFEHFRKFPSGGFRRQVGRGPSKLMEMLPETKVWKPVR